MWRRPSLLALLACSASAAAAPVGIATEQRRRDPAAVEPAATPAPVVDPDPDQASGVAIEDERPRSARWLPRALLFVPKIVLWGVLQPVRGAAYLIERDGAGSQQIDGTFDARHTFGGYPIGWYDSDLGGVVGARAMVKNIFGQGERLRLRVDGGTAITYGVGVQVTTGQRFAPLRFVLDGDLEKHPHDRFYGIGNTAGTEMEFEQQIARGAAAVEASATDDVELRLAMVGTHRELAAAPIDNVYLEGEAAYDTRRPTSIYPSQTLDTAGWLVRGYGRIARGVGDDPTRYTGYGGEVEHVLDLRDSTRTLTLRLLVDAVAGSDDAIPFVDLPSLGGPDYLRGYPSGRFRGRTVVAGTAEYGWRLFNHASGYTFVDAGAPFAGWGPLDDGPLRVGVGGGILIHTKHTSFARAQLAFSRDGDVNVSLAFQPTSGRRERSRRP